MSAEVKVASMLVQHNIPLALTHELTPLFRDITQPNKFYRSVCSFYVRSMEYSLQNLPLKDDLLKNASFLNFTSRENATFTQVEYFVERYYYVYTAILF